MRSWIGLALWLTACTAGRDKDTSDTSDDTDTGTDTDGVDTDDTDVPVDDCEFLQVNGVLSAGPDVAVPNGTIVLGAFLSDLSSDNPFDVSGAPWAQGTSTALSSGSSDSFTWCLTDPPEEHFQGYEGGAGGQDTDGSDTGDTDAGSLGEAAFYFVGGFVDGDGSEGYSAGDPLVHGAYGFLVNFRGALPEDFAGAALGWNYVFFDFLNEQVVTTPLSDGSSLELAANLLLHSPAGLPAVLEPASDGNVRAALFAIYGGEPEDPMLPSVAVDASEPGVEFTLPTTTPPEDHFVEDASVGYAFYGALGWDDTNEDEAFDFETEAMIGDSMAVDGSPTVLYMKPLDFTASYYASMFGQMGWILFDEEVGPLDWSDGVLLAEQDMSVAP